MLNLTTCRGLIITCVAHPQKCNPKKKKNLILVSRCLFLLLHRRHIYVLMMESAMQLDDEHLLQY